MLAWMTALIMHSKSLGNSQSLLLSSQNLTIFHMDQEILSRLFSPPCVQSFINANLSGLKDPRLQPFLFAAMMTHLMELPQHYFYLFHGIFKHDWFNFPAVHFRSILKQVLIMRRCSSVFFPSQGRGKVKSVTLAIINFNPVLNQFGLKSADHGWPTLKA